MKMRLEMDYMNLKAQQVLVARTKPKQTEYRGMTIGSLECLASQLYHACSTTAADRRSKIFIPRHH